MASGVTLVDPRRTYIETEVSIGQDTVIDPGVTLLARRGSAGSADPTGCVVDGSVLSDGVR